MPSKLSRFQSGKGKTTLEFVMGRVASVTNQHNKFPQQALPYLRK